VTQTLRPAAPRPAQFKGAGGGGPVQQRRRRLHGRALVVALGLVLLALAVLVFESLVPKAPHAHEVLVATRQIRAGEVIGPSDLRVVTVASSQLRGVAASARDRVVGHTAGLDVAAGQPLVDADVGGTPRPSVGEAVVGLSLASGRLPGGLAAGDTVVVVATPGSAGAAGSGSGAGAGAGASGTELSSGRVLSVGRSSDGTRTDVSLVVKAASASAVAAMSATDSVSLVWIPR
jgi:hypothetical protein